MVQSSIHGYDHLELGNAFTWLISAFCLVFLNYGLKLHSVHRKCLTHGTKLTNVLWCKDASLFGFWEEGIVEHFDGDTKMIADGMEEATTWYFWRIVIHYEVVVLSNLMVDDGFVKLLRLFTGGEDEIEEIDQTFF